MTDRGKQNSAMPGLLVIAFSIALIMVFASNFYFIFAMPYQKSYREMTMIKYAVDFSRGLNPYSAALLKAELPFNSGCYAFLQSFITGFILRFFPVSRALTVSEVFSKCIDAGAALLVYLTVRKHGCERWISLLAALISARIVSACTAYPHSLGMLLVYLLAFLITRDTVKNVYHPFLYAVIVILAFYSKQYFLLLGPCLFVYLLFRSLRDAVKLAIYGLAIGFGSLFFIDRVFPLYLPLVLVRANIDSNMHGILYILKQIATVVAIKYPDVAVLSLSALFIVVPALCAKYREQCGTVVQKTWALCKSLSYEEVCLLVSVLPVTYISRNHGQFCEYYEQLMVPYAIIWGCAVMDRVMKGSHSDEKGKQFLQADQSGICDMKGSHSEKTGKAVRILMIAAAACGVFLTLSRIPVVYFRTDIAAAKQTWTDTIDIIEENAPNRRIITSPLLANYCLVNDIYTDDYGQAQYNSDRAMKILDESPVYNKYFPEMAEIIEMTLKYRQEVQKQLDAGYYEVVALSSDGRGSLNYDNMRIDENLYKSYGVKRLAVGTSSYYIKIYVRK